MLKYILYRLKWHIAPYFGFSFPVHIDIETNNNCNQRCLSCWHSLEKLPFENGKMTIGQVREILADARKAGALSVKFNLRGEPLLYNHIHDAIMHARDLGFIDIMINTNGFFLTPDNAIRLSAMGLTTCVISVDTCKSETYKKLHGVDQFDKILSNLVQLHYLKQTGAIKFRVHLNVHRNIHNDRESRYFFTFNFPLFRLKTRHTEKREGSDISILRERRRRKNKCPHMVRRLTITANGKIYPCCVCYNEPADIMISNSAKNIKNIWNGDRRRWVVDNYPHHLSCQHCTSGDIWKK